MLRAPRPRPSFSNAQVSAYFFTPCSDEYDEPVPDYYRCRCGTVRKQTRRNGFTNLMQHVRREHPGFEAEMRAATTAETGSLIHYARRTSVNRFGWLEWVVKANLPLVFCENSLARRYTSLDPISVETLKALMEAVAELVGLDIAAELPDRFGLMLDGWSHASVHYVAVFICYEINGVAKYALLSMAPIIQEPDDDLSARTHRDFLVGLLERFGKTLSGCVYLVADNCSVNRRLATIMQVPLIGCASHRLNRAVQRHLEQYEDDLAVVQALMLKLRTLKQSAKLRFKTPLRPVIRQDTRWGSTFAMVHRYYELAKFLDADDDDILELLPSPACKRRLKDLYAELKDIESVSKALQGSDVTLLDARVWFDGLIAAHPAFADYIGPRAAIVHSPDFEAGCVGVLKDSSARLTAAEKRALRALACSSAATTNGAEDGGEEPEGSFVQRLEKRRRLEARKPRYDLISSIPPTSNKVERFFSVARTTFAQERNSLQPATLETILFLRENADFWDVSTIDRVN